MGIKLYPLSKDPDRPRFNFAVCDIEATKWINFLTIGFYTKHYEGDEFQRDEFHHFENMAEFCDFCFEPDQKRDVIIAHFGGKYDFNFILREFFLLRDRYFIHKMIPRGSGLLSFKVSTFRRGKASEAESEKELLFQLKNKEWLIEERTIEFRDSSALLPHGLGSLAENFGVEHQKLDIDYDKITEVTPELLTYLEHDCRALYECLEAFYDQPIIKAAGACSTIASQALKVYRTFIDSEIPSLSETVDQFVRQSYFGGRTEIFKPFFVQRSDVSMLRCFDVNSLYPSVMRDNDFPTRPKFTTEVYLENEMGFYDVEVYVPEMYIPPLGTVYQEKNWGRFIFPTGRFRGVWTTHELNYAVSLGVKILKVYKGIVFHNGGPIFKNYIETLYDIRKKSKKGSVDDMVAKLLMNSTYGRFGLQLEREQLEFDHGQLGVEPYMELKLDEQLSLRLVKRDILLENTFTNCAIASWVTSHARAYMHKQYMIAPEDLYYTDTDSLFSTHKYPQDDNDLGKLKLEYKAKSACFLLPKTYAITGLGPYFDLMSEAGLVKDDEGKKVKTNVKVVMKGFDKKKIAHFRTNDFYEALEGDLKRLRTTNPAKFATLKTAARKNKFLMLLKESPREIRSLYDKRRIVKRAWSQRYDSEPLHIKDGVIVNRVHQLKKSRPRRATDKK